MLDSMDVVEELQHLLIRQEFNDWHWHGMCYSHFFGRNSVFLRCLQNELSEESVWKALCTVMIMSVLQWVVFWSFCSSKLCFRTIPLSMNRSPFCFADSIGKNSLKVSGNILLKTFFFFRIIEEGSLTFCCQPRQLVLSLTGSQGEWVFWGLPPLKDISGHCCLPLSLLSSAQSLTLTSEYFKWRDKSPSMKEVG